MGNKIDNNQQSLKEVVNFDNDFFDENEFYKTQQNDLIIENLLIGEFDDEGRYKISKEFLIELIKIKKLILNNDKNNLILKANLEKFELNFILEMQEESIEVSLAILKFIETVNSYDNVKKNINSVIAKYKDDNDSYFFDKVCKVFNIHSGENSDDEAIDQEVLYKILNRLKELEFLRNNRIDELDFISNTYIDKILRILKLSSDKNAKKLLKIYSKMLVSIEDKMGQSNYFILAKKLLDKLLKDEMPILKKIKLYNNINNVKQEYVSNYKNMHEKLLQKYKESNKIKVKEDLNNNPKTNLVKNSKSASKPKKIVKKEAIKVNQAKIDKKKASAVYQRLTSVSKSSNESNKTSPTQGENVNTLKMVNMPELQKMANEDKNYKYVKDNNFNTLKMVNMPELQKMANNCVENKDIITKNQTTRHICVLNEKTLTIE